MEFKLVYGNHGKDPVHVYETLLLIKYGLIALGHKADLEHNLSPGKTNIILECFTFDFLDVYKEFAATPGTRYILVATEFLTGETFNQFGPPQEEREDMSHYENPRYWRKRYKTFLEASQYASAVWHLSQSQAEVYLGWLDGVRVQYLPHGHVPQLERVFHYPENMKDIDVLFTGTPTAYRKEVLAGLQAQGLAVKFSLPRSSVQREDLVARSRIALNIRQSIDWKYPSNSRFHYHISNLSLLVSERCEESCDLSGYVIETEPEQLYETCTGLIEDRKYEVEARLRLERFREEMPMHRLLEPIVEAACST